MALVNMKKERVIKKRSRKSHKKTRSKTKKPKYLSLRLQFSTDPKKKPQDKSSTGIPCSAAGDHRHPQLNLFPLHPENLVEEKDAPDENMAYLFSAADGGATSLTGLLGTASASSSDDDNRNQSSTVTTLSPPASLTYAYRRQDSEEEVALVRTAMRNKGRKPPSEVRWVRYSEVVERRRDDQEVSSCWRNQRLSLKLDYDEILNSWSDKGSLYVHDAADDSPETVPDICDDFFASQFSNGMSDGWGNNGGCVWRVPEMMNNGKGNEQQGTKLLNVKTEEQQEKVEAVAGEELKTGHRELSVQRYKEKRQNRLFSKRIRYEVRKLNAEKRPRLKGRFVKRS